MPDIKLVIYATSVPMILTGGGFLMLWVAPVSPQYGDWGWTLIFLGVTLFVLEILALIYLATQESNRGYRW